MVFHKTPADKEIIRELINAPADKRTENIDILSGGQYAKTQKDDAINEIAPSGLIYTNRHIDTLSGLPSVQITNAQTPEILSDAKVNGLFADNPPIILGSQYNTQGMFYGKGRFYKEGKLWREGLLYNNALRSATSAVPSGMRLYGAEYDNRGRETAFGDFSAGGLEFNIGANSIGVRSKRVIHNEADKKNYCLIHELTANGYYINIYCIDDGSLIYSKANTTYARRDFKLKAINSKNGIACLVIYYISGSRGYAEVINAATGAILGTLETLANQQNYLFHFAGNTIITLYSNGWKSYEVNNQGALAQIPYDFYHAAAYKTAYDYYLPLGQYGVSSPQLMATNYNNTKYGAATPRSLFYKLPNASRLFLFNADDMNDLDIVGGVEDIAEWARLYYTINQQHYIPSDILLSSEGGDEHGCIRIRDYIIKTGYIQKGVTNPAKPMGYEVVGVIRTQRNVRKA